MSGELEQMARLLNQAAGADREATKRRTAQQPRRGWVAAIGRALRSAVRPWA